MSSFDACVAQHESGDDFALNTGNGYYGAFQFDLPTWDEATGDMGVSWPLVSEGVVVASAGEQIATFDYWSRLYPSAWPNTIPMCGG